MAVHGDSKGSDSIQQIWDDFVQKEGLSAIQSQQYRRYVDALLAWNERSNLTRITQLADIIHYHLQDCMQVINHAHFVSGQMICDIGSGAGFPGLVLAIARPDLRYTLIEVNQKKIAFLRHIIVLLQLEQVAVCEYDWRTFVRRAPVPVNWFVTRASLDMSELMRIFKSGSAYNNAQLIYWASDQWHIGREEELFFIKKEAYTVGSARRWYVFFGKQ